LTDYQLPIARYIRSDRKDLVRKVDSHSLIGHDILALNPLGNRLERQFESVEHFERTFDVQAELWKLHKKISAWILELVCLPWRADDKRWDVLFSKDEETEDAL
ncbi:MAG: hypothetical protein Q9218_003175, partial [Villophora microphyllina]